eukprot:TRINITY_DN21728_c0_g1_i1.p1 TRINITY_DN21728_c0_g1~~TRINITY_DN21728_c0_g1_i1.p1  ORF type:complete len:252 (+),score=73.25 TRINITY_DN21728_c0_g1_i1:154-909(+)
MIRTLNPQAAVVPHSAGAVADLTLDVLRHNPPAPYTMLRMMSGVVRAFESHATTPSRFCYRSDTAGFSTVPLFELLFSEASILNGFGCVFHAEGMVWLEDDPVYSYNISCAGGGWSLSRGEKWADVGGERYQKIVVFLTQTSPDEAFESPLHRRVPPHVSARHPSLIAGISEGDVTQLLASCLSDTPQASSVGDASPLPVVPDGDKRVKILKEWGWRRRKTDVGSSGAQKQANATAEEDDEEEEEEEEEEE